MKAHPIGSDVIIAATGETGTVISKAQAWKYREIKQSGHR